MDQDELLRMLDLDGAGPDTPTADAPAADPLAAHEATGEKPPRATNPNALEMDEWGLRRGRDLLAESPSLGDRGLDEHDLADCHAVAFDLDPRLMPDCADRTKHEFLEQLIETPEYKELHESTALNEAASALAAANFAEQLARLREEECKEGRECRREEVSGKSPEPVPSAGTGAMEEEMRIVRAVGVALDGAARDITELE